MKTKGRLARRPNNENLSQRHRPRTELCKSRAAICLRSGRLRDIELLFITCAIVFRCELRIEAGECVESTHRVFASMLIASRHESADESLKPVFSRFAAIAGDSFVDPNAASSKLPEISREMPKITVKREIVSCRDEFLNHKAFSSFFCLRVLLVNSAR